MKKNDVVKHKISNRKNNTRKSNRKTEIVLSCNELPSTAALSCIWYVPKCKALQHPKKDYEIEKKREEKKRKEK